MPDGDETSECLLCHLETSPYIILQLKMEACTGNEQCPYCSKPCLLLYKVGGRHERSMHIADYLLDPVCRTYTDHIGKEVGHKGSWCAEQGRRMEASTLLAGYTGQRGGVPWLPYAAVAAGLPVVGSLSITKRQYHTSTQAAPSWC